MTSRKHKRNMQRILSLILAVVMVVTSCNWSLVVRAEETEAGILPYEQTDGAAESASNGEEAVPVGEILSLRDESSKQFLMSDGTVSLVQYETDVHYQDAQGEWQEIDNSLGDEEDNSGYSTKAGKVKFKFAKNPNANFLVRIMQGIYHIFFSAVDAQKQSEGAAISESTVEWDAEDASIISQMKAENIHSKVVYENLFEDTDVEYITSGSSLKENLVVKEAREDYTYSFEIQTNKIDIRQGEDGQIGFYKEGTEELLYVIPKMYMWDADGRESDAIEVSLTTKNKKSTLTIMADAEWINAQERVFPVTIDPTLESTNSSTGSDSRIVLNQYVASGNPDTSSAGYGSGYLGYDMSSDKNYRMYVQFKTLPKIPENSVIAAAKFYYGHILYDHVALSELCVNAVEVTENWTWGANLTWNTKPAIDTRILDYQVLSKSTVGTYVGWDITKILKDHYENTDNAAADTSSFALVAAEEGNFGKTYAAKAQIVQQSSSGFFANAQPVLMIAYRDTRGLEDYYTTQVQGLGRAGTAYIGDYTKELTLVRPIFSSNSTVVPFTLSLVYNSAFGEAYFSSTSDMLTKNYDSMRAGLGWKFNVQESVVEKTIGGKLYYVYNDSDGTDHYFALDSSDNTYKDEDGLKLTIEKSTSPVKYTIWDEKDTQRIFHNGYLSAIIDANANALYFLYNGKDYVYGSTWYAGTGSSNKMTKIVQKNRDQETVKTLATFTYGSNGLVQSVTDPAGRTYTMTYTAASGGSGYNLTKITDPDGIYAAYEYYSISSDGTGKLWKTRDSESQTGGIYTYAVTKHASRLKQFAQLQWSSSTSYTKLRTVDITNSKDPMHTIYRDRGIDCTADTADDIWSYYTFDNAGRTVSQAGRNADGTQLYGASSSAYHTGTDAKANKIVSDAATGIGGINILRNGSGETVSGSSASRFTASKSGTASAQTTMAVDGSGTVRTGKKSFRITVADAVTAQNVKDLKTSYSTTAALEAGVSYAFSAYFYNTKEADFGEKSRVYLKVSDSSGNEAAVSTKITQATSSQMEDGWSRMILTFTPSAAGTYTFSACADGVLGTTCFDDLQLEKGSSASSYNYLWNGDVEYSNGWSLSDSNVLWIALDILFGSCAFRIKGDPSKKSTASQTIPLNLSSDNTFVLSGWGRATSVAGINRESSSDRAFGLEAVLTYSDGTTETHYASFDAASTQAQYTSANIVPKKAGKTITSVKVSCVYGKNANTAYFDNISFRKELVTTYKYDSKGNLSAVTSSDNAQMDFTYSSGNLIKTDTESSGVYDYTYDSRHNLTKVKNDGVEMALTYDGMGHVKATVLSNPSQSGGKKISTSAEYTADGDYLKSQTDALGNKVSYTTNSHGLTTGVTDPLNRVTSYTYESSTDRLTKTALSDGTSVSYTYTDGILASIVRKSLLPDGGTSQNQTYSFTYDQYGNVTTVKVGSRTLASYAYLAKNGPLSSITYGNSYVISYTYDALGRVVAESHDNVLKYKYIYGCEGALNRMEELDASGTVVKVTGYEYDSLGRLIRSFEEELKNGEMVRTVSTEHLYDTSNRLVKQSFMSGDGSLLYETYTYDEDDGTLAGLRTSSGKTLSYTYDYLKRLSSRSDGKRTVAYTYTDMGSSGTSTQVQGMTISGQSGGTVTYGYTYDALGNITKVTRNGVTEAEYTYNAQSQLIREKLPQLGVEYAYTYDTGGNIRSAAVTENGTTTTKTYTYGDSAWKDLLTAVNGQGITYDAIGNPLTYYNGSSTWNFTWQNGRRLATATGQGNTISDTYDSEGLRTTKTVNGVKHTYVYLGGQLAEERWGSNYLLFSYDEAGRPYAVNYNGTWYYYVLNQQGDVVRIVSDSGSIQVEYRYNAWGKVDVTADAAGLGNINPIRYRGYYYDAETGFYYVSSRYYDPEVGRFISADTTDILFEDEDNLLQYNLYTYCFNNPVNMIDFTGESPSQIIGAIAGGIGGYALGKLLAKELGLKGAKKTALIAAATLGGAALGAFLGPYIAKLGRRAFNAVKAYGKKLGSKKVVQGACFVKGTLVSAKDGDIPIEDIEVGDLVYSENPETGEKGLKQVVRTFVNQTDELIHVFVENEEIITTPEHPFYVPQKGWVSSIQLRAGDILLLQNGEYIVVEMIQHEILESPITVYNFEVADYHTYYVGNEGILVHNMCQQLLNVFKSIKQAPGYNKNFVQARNGLKKVAVNNKQLLQQLNQVGSGWKKVYQNGWINGQKVSLHYFKDSAGRIFDFKIKYGRWS